MLSYLRRLGYEHIVSCVSARDVLRFLTDFRPRSMIIVMRGARPQSVVNMTEDVELRRCRLRSRHPSFETSRACRLTVANVFSSVVATGTTLCFHPCPSSHSGRSILSTDCASRQRILLYQKIMCTAAS
jgi:hypothetical protein